MASWSRRLLKAIHPEGIPGPFALLYDAISASGIFRRHYELVARDIASYRDEGSLLDIGTGPGRLLLALKGAAPGLHLIGADISSAMVARARSHVARAGLADKIEIIQAAAGRLPMADGSLDVVVSTGSLHHWKDAVGDLNECHRVLKDGGVALMYDLVKKLPVDVAAAAKRDFGRFRTGLLWLHSFEEPFYSPQEMAELAAATRFAGGQTKFVGALCCLVMRKSPRG